jgi:hypothetical protein
MSSTGPTGRGHERVEIPAASCPNGHPLRPPNVQVFWLGCGCAAPAHGHRGYRCWTCGACVYEPPHTGRADAVIDKEAALVEDRRMDHEHPDVGRSSA